STNLLSGFHLCSALRWQAIGVRSRRLASTEAQHRRCVCCLLVIHQEANVYAVNFQPHRVPSGITLYLHIPAVSLADGQDVAFQFLPARLVTLSPLLIF